MIMVLVLGSGSFFENFKTDSTETERAQGISAKAA